MLDHGLLLRRRWSPSLFTGSSWSRTNFFKVRDDTKTSHGRQFPQKFFRSTTTMPGTNCHDDEDEDVSSSSSVPIVFSTIPRLGQGVRVGQYINTTRTYHRHEVTTFARLLHDFNPIHGTNMSNHTNSTEEELRTVMELQQKSYQKAAKHLTHPKTTK